MSVRKKYNSIDLMKLIMAFCVVAIHTRPLSNCKVEMVNGLFDSVVFMAVPFFFLSSGFLLAQKMKYPFLDEKNKLVIKKYLLKIIKLYLIGNTIYLPLTIYYFLNKKASLTESIVDFFKGFFIVGQQYNSWQLWYLLSTIYALVLILLLMILRQNIKRIIMIGSIIFLIVIAITATSYYGQYLMEDHSFLIKIIQEVEKNGRILYGIFYIPIGMFLANRMMSKKRCLILLIPAFITNCIISNESASTVLIAISSIGLFGYIVYIQLSDSLIYPFVREMSMVIYFIHMYIFTAYYMFRYGKYTLGLDSFIITSSISALVSIVFVLAKNRITIYK